MITKSAKQLPHGETKQGMILHSFPLHESAGLKQKVRKDIKKKIKGILPSTRHLWDSLLQDIVMLCSLDDPSLETFKVKLGRAQL